MTKPEKIGRICEEIARTKDVETGKRMSDAFWWHEAANAYPRMTAEEIASMAASTYERIDL